MGFTISTERSSLFRHAAHPIPERLGDIHHEPECELTPEKRLAERAPEARGQLWIALIFILVGFGWPALIVVGFVRLAWRFIAG